MFTNIAIFMNLYQLNKYDHCHRCWDIGLKDKGTIGRFAVWHINLKLNGRSKKVVCADRFPLKSWDRVPGSLMGTKLCGLICDGIRLDVSWPGLDCLSLQLAFSTFSKRTKLAIIALMPILCSNIFAVFLHYLVLKMLVNVKLDVSWQKGLIFKIGDFTGLLNFE